MSRFEGDVEIFPRIGGREPISNITQQLVTCQNILAIPRIIGQREEITDVSFDLWIVCSLEMEGYSIRGELQAACVRLPSTALRV